MFESWEDLKVPDTQVHLIALLYGFATILCIIFLQHFAWAPIQIRVSEALCIVALFSAVAIPELAAGCFVANLLCMLLFGTIPEGFYDVIFGSIATACGALWAFKFRERGVLFALMGFVIANAFIVGAYLPFIVDNSFYVLGSFDFSDTYFTKLAFGIFAIGISESLSIYVLGIPIFMLLKKLDYHQI